MSTTEYRPKQAIATQRRPRTFYGWWIVAARAALLMLVNRIGYYGPGMSLPSPEKKVDPVRPLSRLHHHVLPRIVLERNAARGLSSALG